MLKTIATAALALGLLAGVACSDGGGAKPNLVRDYAACLAEPANPLHHLAGAPTPIEAEGVLQAELASGENTMEDIRAAYTLYCGG